MSVFKRNPAGATSGESGKQLAVDCLRFARRVWPVFLAVGVFLLAAPAHGQLYTGSVTGLVTDPSGGVVPGAKITVVDRDKGFSFTATTDTGGRYLLRSIPPGTYKITAEAPSFHTESREGIKLDVTQNISIDFSLKVGAVSDVVEVRANAVQLQTEDAVTGQVVNRRFINDLPLVDRNFTNLTYLAPGVSETNAPNSKNSQGGSTLIPTGAAMPPRTC
jgi:hypothetical protein